MPVGQFPPPDRDVPTDPPPTTFTDHHGRSIALRRFGEGPVEDEFEALVAFYLDFPPADRSLGVPPVGEARIRRWLETLADARCLLAWHEDRPVGQAVLVDVEGSTAELAIFVGPAFQHAGVGTHLLGSLLAHGRETGVERVWLLVESENRPAVNLYLDFGFAVVRHRGLALEMEVELA
ncbi:MAG: N-acetyltransferase family protein [Haloarculaceae archaeon]